SYRSSGVGTRSALSRTRAGKLDLHAFAEAHGARWRSDAAAVALSFDPCRIYSAAERLRSLERVDRKRRSLRSSTKAWESRGNSWSTCLGRAGISGAAETGCNCRPLGTCAVCSLCAHKRRSLASRYHLLLHFFQSEALGF